MIATRRARWIRTLLVVLAVFFLVATVLWPSPRRVDIVRVDRGPVVDSFDAEGRTRVRDRYVITAPVAATARRLALQPGDTVRAGQVLVVLDPISAPTLDSRTRAETRARIDAAEDQLSAAREQARAADAAASQAAAEAARMTVLATDRLVAAEVAERATTESLRAHRDAASARYLVATAEHTLQAAQAVLAVDRRGEGQDAALELTAPAGGVVLRRHYESARPVLSGDTLLEIGDPNAMEVEVDVLSADAVRLRPGMPVELLRWGEEKSLPATVRRIEPGAFTKVSALGIEEQRVWVIVDFASPREEWLRLGEAYRINARFMLRQAALATRVPTSAVFRHGSGSAVFRIDNGRVRVTPVRVGLEGNGYTEILAGLSVADAVVVHPDRTLADGDRVRQR